MHTLPEQTPNTINRRDFVRYTGAGMAALALTGLAVTNTQCMTTQTPPKEIRISRVDSNFEREPLRRPYGFKGGSLDNIWQTLAYLESESGRHGIGIGVQSVLWSDSRVFARHTQHGGNALMYAIGERALQMVKGQTFTDPISPTTRLTLPLRTMSSQWSSASR